MKFSSRAVFSALFIWSCFAVSSCDRKLIEATRTHEITPKQIDRLKTQTAVLVLPSSEYPYINDYKQLVPQAWTLTPIEVIKYSELGKYTDISKYAFFNIDGLQSTVTNSATAASYSNAHFYLTLSSFSHNEKSKTKVTSDNFGRIELYPDFSTVTRFNSKNFNDRIYEEATIRNFTLPYMLAYLRILEKNIINKTSPSVYNNYTDEVLRSRLAKDTLYIPQDLVFNRNKFTGKETQKEENFFEGYKGRYKVMTTRNLVELIKSRDPKKPLFLFEYVLSSTDKYVGVLEVNSGTVVYRRYTPMTYNLKVKDVQSIVN